MSATYYEKGSGDYDVRSNYEGSNFCILKLEKLSYQNSMPKKIILNVHDDAIHICLCVLQGFRVLEGVLGKSLTLGGEEWEGKIGYLYTYLGGLAFSLFFLLFSLSLKKLTHCFTIPT
jgi:hypothetical protein